MPQAGDTG